MTFTSVVPQNECTYIQWFSCFKAEKWSSYKAWFNFKIASSSLSRLYIHAQRPEKKDILIFALLIVPGTSMGEFSFPVLMKVGRRSWNLTYVSLKSFATTSDMDGLEWECWVHISPACITIFTSSSSDSSSSIFSSTKSSKESSSYTLQAYQIESNCKQL